MIPIHTGRSARVTTFAILFTLLAFICQTSAYAQIGGAANISGWSSPWSGRPSIMTPPPMPVPIVR